MLGLMDTHFYWADNLFIFTCEFVSYCVQWYLLELFIVIDL